MLFYNILETIDSSLKLKAKKYLKEKLSSAKKQATQNSVTAVLLKTKPWNFSLTTAHHTEYRIIQFFKPIKFKEISLKLLLLLSF